MFSLAIRPRPLKACISTLSIFYLLRYRCKHTAIQRRVSIVRKNYVTNSFRLVSDGMSRPNQNVLVFSGNNNKRKYAAKDLGISERTLYRKIKQYEIDE